MTVQTGIDASALLGIEDLTDQEAEFISLGISIAKAQEVTGDENPDEQDVADIYLDDPEDRARAVKAAVELTGDTEYAPTFGQLCVWFARDHT